MKKMILFLGLAASAVAGEIMEVVPAETPETELDESYEARKYAIDVMPADRD